ncbi:CidA/LrgA family protein [Synergistaceae bacterium OttesenSCG-928-I11]|nr:CidA/LrgA family protein [Synergistaceae bacterium OttesenSCG-928-I11]
MKVAGQFAILFVVCMAGVFLSGLFPFPLPASVTAMMLMFFLLLAGAIRPEALREVSDFMLGNMALFFVPPGVAILEHIDLIRGDGPKLLVVCAVSMVLTFAATLVAVRLTVRMLAARRRG